MSERTKILIVDDRQENIVALENLVKGPDIDILSATSGNDALEILLKNKVGLAMLDVQMPMLSGLELARLMRSAERTKAIPIIFVTASQRSRADIFEGYEYGAVDYMTKPLDASVVRSKVRVFVELDQKTKALEMKTVALEQQSHALQRKLEEVEALRHGAEAANVAKSIFLANMSHEIRTPLGAVLGFAELLRMEGQSDTERQSCIVAIERNGELLLKLVDDVLDLSKIEAERVDPERVPVALADVLRDLRAVHGLKAAEKSIDFEVRLSSPLPQTLHSDPVRLKQILHNIVGNAIKFTAKGGVLVDLVLDCGDEMDPAAQINFVPQLKFTITDSGCGLSDEEASRLFQPFMQGDTSTRRKFGGTGLGLTISKRLARLLGGDVTLESSTPAKGSTFQVTLQVPEALKEPLSDPATFFGAESGLPLAATNSFRLAGLSVLVVDDARDNRELLSRFLLHAGAKVDVAVDGRDALRQARDNVYDVILMDIQMPEMDGYEATRQLREQGFARGIVALTAHAMKEEAERCLRIGCDFYLSKPVRRVALIETVGRFLKAR